MKILMCFAFLLPLAAFAESEKPADYAHAYTLELDNNGPVYRLVIPRRVYETITSEGYNDIRVFNSENMAVPYRIEREGETETINQESKAYEIPFFPVSIDGDDDKQASIRIDTRADGTIVKVEPVEISADSQQVNGLLLDLSNYKSKPEVLLLNWEEGHAEFNEVLVVQGSNDLASWDKLTDRASLTNLKFSGQRLVRNKIKLPGYSYNYLRLIWRNKADLSIKQVSGFSDVIYNDVPRKGFSLSPDFYDEETKSFYYSSTGYFPVDRLAVRLKPRNSLLSVSVSSSSSHDGPWYRRYQGLVYNMEKDGQVISSGDIKLYSVNSRYWRITADNGRDGLASLSPTLEMGWLPHKLTFIAEGTPPFMLAFGNVDAGKNVTEYEVGRLLVLQDVGQNDLTGKAIPISLITLGGEDRIHTKIQTSGVNWKVVVLWSVLVLGLVILIVMTMRLFKQMNDSSSVEDRAPDQNVDR